MVELRYDRTSEITERQLIGTEMRTTAFHGNNGASLKPAVATLANQAKKPLFTLMQKVVYLDYPPPFLLIH